jgi:ribosome-binding factor A
MTTANKRSEKVADFIKEFTASYLAREKNNTSLLTVTGANCSPDLKHSTVFITVLPETKEEEALEFARRKRSEIREFLKKNMSTKNIPVIDFAIDQGEKNRQKIDELLRSK